MCSFLLSARRRQPHGHGRLLPCAAMYMAVLLSLSIQAVVCSASPGSFALISRCEVGAMSSSFVHLCLQVLGSEPRLYQVTLPAAASATVPSTKTLTLGTATAPIKWA
jgi:hypothetical protein